MLESLQQWHDGGVLIVGDVMLDRYWGGATERISPEAPVPVVRVDAEEERIGGAANVAANVRSLGFKAELIGGVGDDDAARTLDTLCRMQGIATHLVRNKNNHTIVKLRVMSQHQQLLRLDFEQAPQKPEPASLRTLVSESLKRAAVLVLSDYAKGFLSNADDIITLAKSAGIMVIVDPKSSDFSRYAGANLVTPNYMEFERCVGHCADEEAIESRARDLCERHDIEALLITRGERGMLLIRPRDNLVMALAADAREVFDVTGAGDTVCAVIASALAGGQSLESAVRYANIAAGIAVGKSGTATVARDELGEALKQRSSKHSVHDESTVVAEVAEARARGEQIVMTNGCFDILHAGHVSYLRAARQLGGRLLVALNSDDSVARLKGPSRPINCLADRMAVLSELACVDWVVSFNEDTPLRLIETLTPDFLVKGGDYAVDDIVGGEHVVTNGGEVVVLPFVEGRSTSALIDSIASGQGTLGKST